MTVFALTLNMSLHTVNPTLEAVKMKQMGTLNGNI